MSIADLALLSASSSSSSWCSSSSSSVSYVEISDGIMFILGMRGGISPNANFVAILLVPLKQSQQGAGIEGFVVLAILNVPYQFVHQHPPSRGALLIPIPHSHPFLNSSPLSLLLS
jgi:hypothetical protein